MTTEDLLRERLAELSPRDTFELGMYRLLAWGGSSGASNYHHDRLTDWSRILKDIAARLDKAASRE